MQESKEKIRSRMIKNASKLWGFQDTQLESSFDPFVGMILGALANELAKISYDITTIESRVLEKLVELLTPEPVTGPFPSHALIRAKSVDPVFEINSNQQFFTNKRFVKPKEHNADEIPVFFTPAGNYKLFNGQIKYQAAASKIFRYDEELEKEVIAAGRTSASLDASEIWLGIEFQKGTENLNGLSICFDLRNEAFESSFYESLSKGKWTINDKTVNFKKGFIKGDSTEATSVDLLLQKELDVSTKIKNHINNFYQEKFQTLADENISVSDVLTDEKYPDIFNTIFSVHDLEKIEENIVWLRIRFPQVVQPGVYDDLFCLINCFPVFNRHLNEFTQSSREFINIIPLVTEELFFDMKEVTTGEGRYFTGKSFSGIKDVEEGTYIVRHGGVGRFDSRNAAEIVSYLLELLRDESAAFSIIGADMIASDLKELNQTIKRLEQRLDESNVIKTDTSYLMLKAHPEDDTLFVEFWTTNGVFGNNIKSGEKLFVYEGSDLWPDSVSFVTTTVGGRESLDTEGRVNAYRKALLSHGRVVTKEDIKALCFEHIGKKLKSVEVKTGLQTGKSTHSGFTQTLDVFLTLEKSNDEMESSELQYMKKDLLLKLKEQSTNVLPFRCFINDAG